MKKADGSHHGRHQRSTMDRLTNFVKKKHRQSTIEEERGEFHEKCGKFVVFDPDRLVASRQADTSSNGIVFSAKPISAGGMFQVKILSLSQCTGSLVSDRVCCIQLEVRVQVKLPISKSCTTRLYNYTCLCFSESRIILIKSDRSANLLSFISSQNIIIMHLSI